MMRPPEISINRLAIYYRFLSDYLKEKGENSTINSEDLARSLDINPHQIRKDLSYFGKFGSPGVGYRVKELRDSIGQILGLNKKWNLCICGVGNLGSALFAYKGFKEMNLDVVALFDNDERKVGRNLEGVNIYSTKGMGPVIKWLNIEIAIIAVPAQAAQALASELVGSGVRAILNFAPIQLNVPKKVKLRNVDLSNELLTLTHFLSKNTQ